jgi:hypothetical protein
MFFLLFSSLSLFFFISDYQIIKSTLVNDLSNELSFIYYTKLNATTVDFEQLKILCKAKESDFPEEIKFLQPVCKGIINGSINDVNEAINFISLLTVNEALKPLDQALNNYSAIVGLIYGLTLIVYIIYAYYVLVYAREESMLLFGLIAGFFVFVFNLLIGFVIDSISSSVIDQITTSIPPDFTSEALKIIYSVRSKIIIPLLNKSVFSSAILLFLPIIGVAVYKIVRKK